MSRTRNRVKIAHGTIADNARRQMSLINQRQCMRANIKY